MSHAWTAPIMTAWSPPPSTAKEDLQHSKGSEKQWTCMRIATWGWQRHTPGISKSTKPLTVTDRDASRTLSCPPPWSQTTPYAKDAATVGAQHFPPNAMMRQNRKEKNSFTEISFLKCLKIAASETRYCRVLWVSLILRRSQWDSTAATQTKTIWEEALVPTALGFMVERNTLSTG